jgi:hypothetical protein
MAAEVQTEKPTYARKKCEHGKQACQCIQCGTGTCIHKKIKSLCIECEGSGICIHKIIKSRCVECKGGSICEHSKRRSRCIECQGGSICPHKQLKSRCVECNGNALCIHKKRKEYCIECATSECICEHQKRKSRCTECQGTEICPHGNNKYFCIECDGKDICEHKKVKNQCVECDGTRICEHKKRKSICVECNGAYICEHKKQRNQCIICTPDSGCQHCKSIGILSSRWKPYCFRCYCVLNPNAIIPRQFKLKEHYVMDALKDHYKDTLTLIFDKTIEGGCSKHRPDLFIDFGTHCLIIEIDENQHTNYICEQKRMIALYEDNGFRKIVFIRFNPDGYKESSHKYTSPFEYTPSGMIRINKEEMTRRIARLVDQIDAVKEEPIEPLTIHYLFFTSL